MAPDGQRLIQVWRFPLPGRRPVELARRRMAMRDTSVIASGMRVFRGILVLTGLLLSPVTWMTAVHAAELAGSRAPVLTHRGTIDVIDLESNHVVISGMNFEVPLDVPVTIRGGAGAFTLLQEGMKAEVVYYDYPDTRVAISLDQLPDNTQIEQF
jgi:hypothetical protein